MNICQYCHSTYDKCVCSLINSITDQLLNVDPNFFQKDWYISAVEYNYPEEIIQQDTINIFSSILSH